MVYDQLARNNNMVSFKYTNGSEGQLIVTNQYKHVGTKMANNESMMPEIVSRGV